MNELDSAAKALFGVARDALAPPAGAEARVFSKLSAVTGFSALTLAASSSASAKPMASVLAKLSGAIVRLLPTAHVIPIAAVTLSGAAIGLWSHEHGAQRQLAHDAASHRATAATSAKTSAQKPPIEDLPLVAERHLAAAASSLGLTNRASNLSTPSKREVLPDREVATDVRSQDVPASSAPKGSSGPIVGDDSQAVTEMVLVGRMHSAWRSGDMRQVAEKIAEHQEHFPHGMFAEEREAMRAMLGCRQNTAHASDIATDFGHRYARSPYQARVNVGCGLTAPEKAQ